MGTIDALIELESLGVEFVFRNPDGLLLLPCLCGRKGCKQRRHMRQSYGRITEMLNDGVLNERLLAAVKWTPQYILDRLAKLGCKIVKHQ